MPIIVDIDVMLAKRKMPVGVLAEKVGITPANCCSKNGRAKAVRFTTLEALCEVLECQPGDLLRWEAEDRWDSRGPSAGEPVQQFHHPNRLLRSHEWALGQPSLQATRHLAQFVAVSVPGHLESFRPRRAATWLDNELGRVEKGSRGPQPTFRASYCHHAGTLRADWRDELRMRPALVAQGE